MSDYAKEIVPVSIEDEMRQSYLDYAMSVIVGRALPDVRDGLKPVHRRVLYSMHEQSNDWNKAYRKSARVVGDVMGKYHPHGDSAIYDTMVRMAQPFSLRYMLVDGQGNFGSIDGDAPAAMRYTEVRMSRIAHELLADIDKQTVDFSPNYDETEHEPVVLPSRVPNLLVNGSSGIAVGMATNIPPHNLSEVVAATLHLLDNPEASVEDLMALVPGPDFPTAGIINGSKGIREAYRTGRGRVHVRARTHIETDERTSKDSIIVTELPYQVNKARLMEKIAELVKEKRIEGITELRDESDKDGMRMVIELRRGEQTEVVLNNLYQQTQLQSVFGINMVALVDSQPRLLNLREIIDAFVRHRREVVTRRTIFELRKARDRAHVLEGLAVALSNIDPIIALIKAAKSPQDAREGLMGQDWAPGMVAPMLERAGADAAASRPDGLAPEYGMNADGYRLTEVQARAILDMQLQRLTGLEQDKIVKEYEEVLLRIADLLEILQDPERLRTVVRTELEAITAQYGDARRTEIHMDFSNLTVEDLINEEDVVVTLSHAGYAKAQPLSDYQTQRRGGRGKSATAMKDEDFIDKLFVASTHDTVLFFTSRGKVYWKKVYELPIASRGARGRPIVNLLPLEEGERVNATLAVREFPDDQFVFFATKNGVVKKTPLAAFSRPLSSGIIAIDLRGDDTLVDVAITDGQCEVMLVSAVGQAMRFAEADVRAMGRNAAGVRGIRLADGEDRVVALIVCELEGEVLTATSNGYGKRTHITEYPCKGRGGRGVIDIKTDERNGMVIGASLVNESDEAMLISDGGTLVRTAVSEVRQTARNTMGVRLIRLTDGEHLVELERVATDSTGDEDDEETPEAAANADQPSDCAAADDTPAPDSDSDAPGDETQ